MDPILLIQAIAFLVIATIAVVVGFLYKEKI